MAKKKTATSNKTAKKKTVKKKKAKAKKKTGKTAGRASTKKTSNKRKSSASSALPKVCVQMFRHGLGDSFLLTFDHEGPNEKRMLIDCGTLGSKSATKIGDVTDHIRKLANNNKKINILVATHEHQDHVSAFKTKKMQEALAGNVDRVWLAWTENPEDPIARKIRKYTEDLGLALSKVAGLAAAHPASQQVADLLEFAGDVPLGAHFAKTVHEAMEFVRKGTGGNSKTVYHKPGDVIGEDLLPGFRVYVLGPPKDEVFLRNLGSHHSDELFGVAKSLSRTAVRHEANATINPDDETLPFDRRFNQHGDRLEREQYATYVTPAEEWRRIDFDWIEGAAELALQLDSLTNNTSLALAIERIADGKVLLFPADAQLGSWLSWHDEKLKWTFKDENDREQTVTAANLLSRTVFYKVGHHGSHNATAKGKGLEMMTQQDELVAFIPVDRAIALGRSPKGTWQMPARPLYLELLRRCQGRVVRADLGWAVKTPGATLKDDTEGAFIGMGSEDEWKTWTQKQNEAKHVKANGNDSIFFEYVLN